MQTRFFLFMFFMKMHRTNQPNNKMFLSFLISFAEILGVSKDEMVRYQEAIDEEKQVFRCFSSGKLIPLKYLNDNFVDCEDGSDEPGTPAITNGTFYCKNVGYYPQQIPKWSVSDGVCDCCDGSDELFNTRISCPNTCNDLNKEREAIYAKIKTIQQKGIEINQKRLVSNEKLIQKMKDDIIRLKLEKKRAKESEEFFKKIKEEQTNDNTKTKEESINQDMSLNEPQWKQIIRKIWKITFHVHDYRTQKYSKSYIKKSLDNARAILNQNRKVISGLKQKLNYTRNDVEKSLIHIYGIDYNYKILIRLLILTKEVC